MVSTKGRAAPTGPFNAEMIRKVLADRKTRFCVPVKHLRVNLPISVSGDGPFRDTFVNAGIHDVELNPRGAAFVIANNGRALGIKPNEFEWHCPYGSPGDRLWVREDFVVITDGRHATSIDVVYRADGEFGESYNRDGGVDDSDRIFHAMRIEERCLPHYAPRWRPSIHMPRWASRILLEITDVAVERVQEIGGQDLNPWIWAITFKRIENA